MPRTPRQSRSRLLADSVVTAAEELLLGSGSLSISRLARRAGVGVASIYDYFSDKAGVLDAVVDRLTVRNFEALASEVDAHQDLTPHQLVDRLSQRVIELYLDPSRSQLMTRVALLTIRRSDPKLHLHYLGLMADKLAQRARRTWTEVTPEEARVCLEGICHFTIGMVLMQLLRGTFDNEHSLGVIRRATLAELEVLQTLHEQRAAS